MTKRSNVSLREGTVKDWDAGFVTPERTAAHGAVRHHARLPVSRKETAGVASILGSITYDGGTIVLLFAETAVKVQGAISTALRCACPARGHLSRGVNAEEALKPKTNHTLNLSRCY